MSNFRNLMIDYYERFKYRTYISIVEKNRESTKDLYYGETYSRVLCNSDLIFTGVPTWFFLFSVIALIATTIYNYIPQNGVQTAAIGLATSLIGSLILCIVLFKKGKVNVKAALAFDFCTTIGLIEILALIVIYVPLLIVMGFKS